MPVIERLAALNPLFQALHAMDLMYARRYDEAVALLQRTLEAAPHDLVALKRMPVTPVRLIGIAAHHEDALEAEEAGAPCGHRTT